MSTEAQINANRANAEHSTGPRSKEGKAHSCRNNFRWGFVGSFTVLPAENQDDFDDLCSGLFAEHSPDTPTEQILVEKMARHLWLSRRAQDLQDSVIVNQATFAPAEIARRFALFLRYQTTNDRAFHKCLGEMLKLRAERRKAEIGFERQKQRIEAEQAREDERARRLGRTAEHERQRLERHKLALGLAEAKLERQKLLNIALDPASSRAAQVQKAA